MADDANKPIDLRQAAAESTAGELNASDQAAFAHLAEADASLREDCAFWNRLRSGLTPPPPPALGAPGPRFAQSIWQRHAWQIEQKQASARAVVLPFPRWLSMAMAAGLALIIGVIGSSYLRGGSSSFTDSTIAHNGPTTQISAANTVFQDDGGIVGPPSVQHVNWANYMPLASVKEVDVANTSAHTGKHRPWLGLWTKPVTLLNGKADVYGHLIVTVASNGPADNAGLEPGDVILAIDHVTVCTPHCVADHLVHARPGDELLIRFWSAKTASISEIKVTLGCVCQ